MISCPARLKSEIYDRNSFTFNISFFVLGQDANCYVDSCLRLSEALINAEKECSFLTGGGGVGGGGGVEVTSVEKICESVFQAFNSSEGRLTTVIGNDVISLSRVKDDDKSKIIPPVPNKSGVPILTASSFVAKDLTVPFIVPSLNGSSTIREVAVRSEVDVGNILQCVRVIVREGKGVLRSKGGSDRGREGKGGVRGGEGMVKEIVHCYPCAVLKLGRRKTISRGLAGRLDEVVVAAVDGTRSEEELEDILGLKVDEIKRSCERMGRDYVCVYI